MIEVIKEQCISCGLCITAPENDAQPIFGWDDEGKCEVINQIVDENTEERISICPTAAIIINE